MFLMVRDEDIPTVTEAVTARAEAAGLESVDVGADVQDPFAMLAVLTGPRVMVAQGEEQVVVTWLASLGLGGAEAWGRALSEACGAEVLVVEAAERGARVEVWDDGTLDEAFDVPLARGKGGGAPGLTRAPALAYLAATEDGERALEDGLEARTVDELVQRLAEALGAGDTEAEGATLLAFRGDAESDDEPALVVAPMVGAMLDGEVGGSVASMIGQPVFGVTLAGAPEVRGIALELDGDALDLVAVDEVDVGFRLASGERDGRTLPVPAGERPIVLRLPDAVLEHVPDGMPDFDPTDMFATMQRMQAAAEARVANTLAVLPRGKGLRAGEGRLVLRARALGDPALAAGEAHVPVRVRAPRR